MRVLLRSAPRRVHPTDDPRVVRSREGRDLCVPDDWVLVPAGRARRLAALGPCWLVEERVGRERRRLGAWAPRQVAAEAAAQEAVPVEVRARRVEHYLDFAPRHAEVQRALARRVAAEEPRHLAPALAVARWLCAHVTPGGGSPQAAPSATRRRWVAALLADRSAALLDACRAGHASAADECPLRRALGDRD